MDFLLLLIQGIDEGTPLETLSLNGRRLGRIVLMVSNQGGRIYRARNSGMD